MSQAKPNILAIESSCDDTSCAILSGGKVLCNLQANQVVHSDFGGVVPELASREHMKNILPLVHQSIKTSGIKKEDLDAVAFTRGPGLMGSLLVGVSFAKAFALGLGKPLIDVNHMQAHVGAHYIEQDMPFPFLCLTVSGGHTQLVIVRDYLDMELVGETLDDAAGEAFDKSAKMFGLPYPGGPLIDKYAQLGEPKFTFSKSKVPGLNFSFSGLKTSILYFINKQDENFVSENLNDLSASVQDTIIEMLMEKTIEASEKYDIKNIAIAGGVSANSGLRNRLEEIGAQRSWNTFIPSFEYCTDNAAMIGIIGHYKYLNNEFADLTAKPVARWSL